MPLEPLYVECPSHGPTRCIPVVKPQPLVKPQPPAPGLPDRCLEPLPPPDALHPFVVHHPSATPKQGGDPPVPVPAESGGKRHDVIGQGPARHPWSPARSAESTEAAPVPGRPAARIPQAPPTCSTWPRRAGIKRFSQRPPGETGCPGPTPPSPS